VAPANPDLPIPGINEAAAGHADNIAAEIIGWLDLPAGLTKLGVNSDDGFRLTVGHEAGAAAGLEVGVLNAGRTAADSTLAVVTPAAGLYPVRLVWFEGGGDSSLEFFSIDATGQKVLINDTSRPTAIRAYYNLSGGGAAPQITRASRSGGNIVIEWSGGGTLEAATSLNPPVTWSPLNGTGTYTEPASAPHKFFRVRR
jgi:hypothetical protein